MLNQVDFWVLCQIRIARSNFLPVFLLTSLQDCALQGLICWTSIFNWLIMLSQVFASRGGRHLICFLYRNKAIQVSFSYIYYLWYHFKSLQFQESLTFHFPKRDVIADANILQGAIFHEDSVEGSDSYASSDSDKVENQNGKEYMWNPLESKTKKKSTYKPAAHRVNNLLLHLMYIFY